MDAQQSALDSLRTVEFRETLKGYHRDDVDEYLEKAAVEAEGLQEQLRQSGERLRQAAERIAQLEAEREQQPAVQNVDAAVPDDTLQRTLLLAQKFVDETKADAESRASQYLADAQAKSRQIMDEAQGRANQIAADSEQRLREEITRLEESRARLSHQVESMTRHLESERNRLRTALGDILRWVDQNVQPSASEEEARYAGSDGNPPPTTPTTATPAPASVLQGGNRPVAPPPAASQQGSGTGPSGEVTRMQPTGVVNRSQNPTTPLPL